jgi:hypothetical protein
MATLTHDSEVRRSNRSTARLLLELKRAAAAQQPEPLAEPEVAVPTPNAEKSAGMGDWTVIGVAANLIVIALLALVSQYTPYSTLTLVAVELATVATAGALLALAGFRKVGLLLVALGATPLIPISLPVLGCLLSLLVESTAGKYLFVLVMCAIFVVVRELVTKAQTNEQS